MTFPYGCNMASANRAPRKSWVFTLHKGGDERESEIQRILAIEDLSRGICGRETCPTTGRPHIQGALWFKRAKRFSAIKALLGAEAHIEPMMDSAGAWDYCGKEGNASTVDHRKRSNHEITSYKDAVLSGATETDLMENHTAVWARYPQLAGRIRTAKAAKTRSPPTVIWLAGPTGVGKTRWAWEHFPDLDVITYQSSGGFFLGVRGSTSCLIDDFRAWDIPFALLLRLLDRYPLVVPVKGGEMSWTYETIIVTCPHKPNWLDSRGEDITQLVRRISKVYLLPDEIDAANLAFGPPGQVDNAAGGAGLEPEVDLVHDVPEVHEWLNDPVCNP